MADEIKQVITIAPDISKIPGALNSLEGDFKRSFGRIEGMAKSVGGTLSSAFGITIGIGGLAAAGTAFLNLAKNAAEYQDSIGKAAQATGVSTEALSAWRHGAELADVSTEELETAIARYSRQIASAAEGNKEAANNFASLGISVRNSAGDLKSTEELLGDLAERFARMPDGAQKTNAAMELLGRSGARLIPLLNGGRDSIKAFTEEAERMGLIVSAEAAQRAEQFNDNLLRLQKQVEGLKIAIGNSLIPVLVRLLDLFGQLGGVKLEGFDQRALERQIATLKELQRSATPGTRGFEFYANAIAEAEGKLKALNESQKKVEKAKTPPITIKTNADKVKNELDNFFDSLEKQLDTLNNKQIELKFGENFAVGAKLDAQLDAFKEKLRAQNMPIPKGLDEFFAVLRDKIVAADEATRKLQESLKQLEGFDLLDASTGSAAIQKMEKEAAAAAGRLREQLAGIESAATLEALPESERRIEIIRREFEERKKIAQDYLATLKESGATEAQIVAETARVNESIAKSSQAAVQKINEDIKKDAEDVTEFQRRQWERMADAISDLLTDLLDGQIKSWDDLAKRISRTLSSITAEAASAELKKILLGENYGKKGGELGGVAKGAMDWFQSIFGGSKPKPQPVPAYEPSSKHGGTTPADILDAERGREMRDAAGLASPATQQFSLATTQFQAAVAQFAAAAGIKAGAITGGLPGAPNPVSLPGGELNRIPPDAVRTQGDELISVLGKWPDELKEGVDDALQAPLPDFFGALKTGFGEVSKFFGADLTAILNGLSMPGASGASAGGGGIFGSLLGPFFGGGSTADVFAGGATGFEAGFFHEGGPIGADTPELAAKIKAGLKPGERPIIAEDGEFMMSKEAVRAIGLDRLEYANQKLEFPRFHDGGALGNVADMPVVGGPGSSNPRADSRGGRGMGGMTININGVNDFESFRRSQSQMEADLARMVRRVQKDN